MQVIDGQARRCPTEAGFQRADQVADALAKEGVKKEDSNNITIFIVPSIFVEEKLTIEMKGTNYAREVYFEYTNSLDRNVIQLNIMVSANGQDATI